MRAEPFTGPVAHHAEGPVWSDAWGGLRWVDMLAGDVLSLAADGTVQRRHVGDVAAAVAKALTTPSAAGRIYELGGPRVYSYRALVRLLGHACHDQQLLVQIIETTVKSKTHYPNLPVM